MNKWNSFKVSRELCKLVENINNHDWSRVMVKMPKDSKYEGYHFLHQLSKSDECKLFWNISYTEDYIFELIKTERKEGERYPRPKISAIEIASIFTAQEKNMIYNNCCLVEIANYDKRIFLDTSYDVGKIQEKWFMSINGGTDKRVSARGFNVVSELSNEQASKWNDYNNFKYSFQNQKMHFKQLQRKIVNVFEENIELVSSDTIKQFEVLKDDLQHDCEMLMENLQNQCNEKYGDLDNLIKDFETEKANKTKQINLFMIENNIYKDFDEWQQREIRVGLEDEIDVSKFLNKDLNFEQMREIRKILTNNKYVSIEEELEK